MPSRQVSFPQWVNSRHSPSLLQDSPYRPKTGYLFLLRWSNPFKEIPSGEGSQSANGPGDITWYRNAQNALTQETCQIAGHESDRSSGNAAFVQAVADKNVVLTLERIRERSAILRGMADKGDIGLAGAMYDVHTGQATFM